VQLRPGSQVGPFRVVREIARGGQGAVLEALGPSGDPVALKLLLDDDDETEARFMREAEVLGRLQHPNLIQLVDRGQIAGGISYLAMELVHGQSLSDWVRGAGPPPLDEVLRVMESAALALHYCHEQGLVHRDLKPQNLLLEDETGRVVVVDFGLVRRNKLALAWSTADRASLTQEGSVLGTPAYMAPEQISPEFGHLDRRADVYGLGATLFFLLTGEAPFRAPGVLQLLTQVVDAPPPDPRSLRPDLPGPLAELCLRSLAKDPSERPSTAEAFATALGSAPAPRRGSRVGLGLVGLVGAAVIGALASRASFEAAAASPTPSASPLSQPAPATPSDSASPEDPLREALARGHRLAQGSEEERREGIRLLEELASKGSSEAKFRLGMAYHERASPLARRWLREAAEEGHAKAAVNLGVIYDKGQGVQIDRAEAERWYRAAVAKGIPAAETYLGYLLLLDTGEPEKQAEGHALLQRSLARGDLGAIVILAHCARTGQGIPQDIALAGSYYERAVALGHAPSMVKLARLYDKGQGVPRDEARAFELYRRAAKGGEKAALFRVGEALFHGRGVERDWAEALKWFERAAAFDDADALTRVGVICIKGAPGVTPDSFRAVTSFERAAKAGSAEAMFLLGQCLIGGQGTAMNPREGRSWIRKAVEADHPPAVYYYSVALKKGDGVPKDLAESLRLLQRAAELKHVQAMGVWGASLLAEESTQAEGAEWLTRAAKAGDAKSMFVLGACYAAGKAVPRDLDQAKAWYRRAAEAPGSPVRDRALESLRSLEEKEAPRKKLRAD
jgi:uncharacterized protein